MTTFAERLQQALADRGMSQRELADMAGVHPSTIYRWLYEDTLPRRAQLRAVAQALGVDEDWLIGRSENPQIPVDKLLTSIREAQALLERALKILDVAGVSPSSAPNLSDHFEKSKKGSRELAHP